MSPELHISLADLKSNLSFFRRIIKKPAELSAVVKSDAYGLGITKIVPEIVKCTWIEVKTLGISAARVA